MERLLFKLLILAIALGVYFSFKNIIPNLDFKRVLNKVMLITVVSLMSLLIFVTFKYGI
ncbi:hypothetical protein MKLM6_0283 [Methylomonas koyamae]|nr:hypothetical protein MKLM6_0283 [Methylomonas koyamae]